MPRSARIAPGGMLFRMLDRANGGLRVFGKEGDYAALQLVMAGANCRETGLEPYAAPARRPRKTAPEA